MKEPPSYMTYILECADGSLYTGWTNDLSKRLEAHNAAKGSRYTRVRRPVKLAASWAFSSRRDAMSFESRIKTLSRAEKLQLIEERLRELTASE